MKPVVFRSEARQDALAAYQWYERERPGLGSELRAELDRTIERICATPRAFPVLWRETRRARLRRFPYAVFFREYEETFVVVAVLHGRRDPSLVQGRVK